MASAIRKLTGVGGDVRKIARLLQKKAPPGHMLAYINQEEADLLKARGGSGKPHADTGVPSFELEDPSTYLPEFSDVPSSSRVSSYNLPSIEKFEQTMGTTHGAYLPERLPTTYPSVYKEIGPFYPSNTASETVPMTDASSGYYRPTLPSAPQTAATPVASVAETPVYTGNFQDVPASSRYDDLALANQFLYKPSDIGSAYSLPEQYALYGTGRQAAEDAAALNRIGAPPPDKDLLGQVENWWNSLKPDTKARLGIGGVEAIIGAYQTSQAAEQARKAREDIAKVAQPYQEQGRKLIAQAQSGALTPAAQQTLQAAQAQAAQGAQARGGVGAQQAQAQVEALRQQLLQQQYDYGLKVLGIGDQIAVGAIKAGMQADSYVNSLASSYANNIARTVANMSAAPAKE